MSTLLYLSTRLLVPMTIACASSPASIPPQIRQTSPRLPQMKPVFVDGELATNELSGAWRVSGYNYVLEFENDAVKLSSECPAGRWPAPTSDLFELEDLATGPAAKKGTQWLRVETGGASYLLEPLELLPPLLDVEDAEQNSKTFEVFESLMEAQYPFFELREYDWSRCAKKGRQRLGLQPTDSDLFEAMRITLAKLGDGHVSLEATVDGDERTLLNTTGLFMSKLMETGGLKPSDLDSQSARQELLVPFLRAIQKGVVTELYGKRPNVAGGMIPWGVVRPGLGYIVILNMSPDDEDATVESQIAECSVAIDEAMRGLADVDTIIVDVSFNPGGTDHVANTYASRFLGAEGAVYTKEPASRPDLRQTYFVAPGQAAPNEGETHEPQSQQKRFDGNVFIVTSSQTASAAELFVMALKDQPHVTVVGRPTAGIFSDIVPKRLPNGWLLNTSMEVYRDTEGTSFEHTGIPVDIERDIFGGDDLFTSHAESLSSIFDLALEQTAPIK